MKTLYPNSLFKICSIINQYKIKLSNILIILFFLILNSSCTNNQTVTQEENKIVKGISDEVALYQFHYKYGASRMGEVITAAEDLLTTIQNPNISMTEAEIEMNVHKLTWLWLAATPTTEYKTLVNSGEISMLTSVDLRRKLKEMNFDQEKLLQFEKLQIDYVNQELRPYLNSRIDKTTLKTRQNFDALETKKVSSPYSSSPKDLLKDREFANLLVDLLFFTKRLMLPYNRLNILLEEMEEIIEEDYPTVEIVEYKPF